MDLNTSLKAIHPNGEQNLAQNSAKTKVLKTNSNRISCDTYQGTVHIEYDSQAPVTPFGQLPFFIDFLKTIGVYDQWVKECPLESKFNGPNSSGVSNILGTYFLSCISGQKRYAHITSIRNDEVNPPLLGMTKIVSEDTARRAFQFIDEKNPRDSEMWLKNQQDWAENCYKWQINNLKHTYEPILCEPWILDVDVTVKPLYGNQEGAEVGYNPKKPGRPSHAIHTYMIAGVRLVLDAEVLPGNQTAASHTLPALLKFLDELPYENQPSLIRGDNAYGNEGVLVDLEDRGINYLFKLKGTPKVKKLVSLISHTDENEWIDCDQGWSAIGSEIQLMGWTQKRKILILRRPLKPEQIEKCFSQKGKPGRPMKEAQETQLLFSFMNKVKEAVHYEYAVLVTNLNLSAPSIAQIYRDRADCENVFDELKNQWGWGGFVTQDLLRSQITARIVAQTYNWWSLFTRLAISDKRKEAITSRPLLMYGVGRRTTHAGQTTITVTPTHAKHALARELMTKVKSTLRWFSSLAEQFTKAEKWTMMLSVIFRHFLKGRLIGSIKKMRPPSFLVPEFG